MQASSQPRSVVVMIPHILIVDADNAAAQTTGAIVQHAISGATITSVASAELGLLSLERQPPAVLIIDPSPQGLSDVALIVAAHALPMPAQVLVLTSRPLRGVRRQLEAQIVDGYLEKSAPPHQLAAQILGLITGAQASAMARARERQQAIVLGDE
jgi:DNA-binding NarL/FixJ family response regulator